MRPRNRIIALLLIAPLCVAVLVLATPKSAAPAAISVVRIAEGQDTKRVTVEFSRIEPTACFAEAQLLQLRVGGVWQSRLSLPKFEDLLARRNRQRLVFDFPRETEACRFSLGYRAGARPYCQAYFFLSRHGISQKFPAISKAILKCVPQQPRLRQFECELEIPTTTHNKSAAPSGLSAVCSSVPEARERTMRSTAAEAVADR